MSEQNYKGKEGRWKKKKKTACMRVSADHIDEKKINHVMEWNQISCPNQSSCQNEKLTR